MSYTALMRILAFVSISLIGAIVLTVAARAAWSDVPSVSVLVDCLGKERRERFLCAEKNIQAMLDHMSPGELVLQLETVSPRGCHYLGHVIGQQAYRRTRSLEQVSVLCDPRACSRACMHGAVAEALLSVAPEIATDDEMQHPDVMLVKEKSRELCVDADSCHAVGHVLFSLYEDLNGALAACDEVMPANAPCHRGVFMENSSATLESSSESGITTHYRDPDDVLFPCQSVARQYQYSCYHFLFLGQEPVLLGKGMDDGKMLAVRIAACASIKEGNLQAACFEGLGWSLGSGGSLIEQRLDQVLNVCATLTEGSNRNACVFGMTDGAMDMGKKPDEALSVCETATEPPVRRACYIGIFNGLRDRKQSYDGVCARSADVECAGALESYQASSDIYALDPSRLPF